MTKPKTYTQDDNVVNTQYAIQVFENTLHGITIEQENNPFLSETPNRVAFEKGHANAICAAIMKIADQADE